MDSHESQGETAARVETGEYISEHAPVGTVGTDALDRSALAKAVADLVRSAAPPVHIALFGPWGSGKTQLLGLIESEFIPEDELEAVRFDAWKYAKEPLGRAFLLNAARSLGANGPATSSGSPAAFEFVSEKLYSAKKRVRFKFTDGLKQALAASVIALVILVVYKSTTASNPDLAPWVNTVWTLSTSGLMVAVVSALVLRVMTVDQDEPALSSQEQFESLFHELVERFVPRGHAVVFLIDELDRCTALQVFEVLETIKTFLNSDRCAFVVAADRQALDAAIDAGKTKRQEDPDVPYYSTAAEYLDKVFEHQVTIPPLHNPRVTAFAKDLVQERGGVWGVARDSAQLDVLVTVLIPTHVISLRRSKVLLNAFVTQYRYAMNRYNPERPTSAPPVERMLELAKLSTIRLEFPEFYDQITKHYELVRYLTEVVNSRGALSEASAQAAERDGAYKYIVQHVPFVAVAADPDPSLMDELLESGESRLLLRYLLKTGSIKGPGREAILMESAAAGFGLSSEVADHLEQDAEDGDSRGVLRLVEKLPAEQRPAALAWLADLARRKFGLDAENALLCILHCVSAGVFTPESVPGDAVASLRPLAARGVVDVELIPACMQVAVSHDTQDGESLAATLLRDKRLLDEANLKIAAETAALTSMTGGHHIADVRQMVLSRGPGLIAAIHETGHIRDLRWRRILAEDTMFAVFAGIEGEEEDTASRADFVGLVDFALGEDGTDFRWSLLNTAERTSRADLAAEWLARFDDHPVTADQADLVIIVVLKFDLLDSATLGRLDGAPAPGTSSSMDLLDALVRRGATGDEWTQVVTTGCDIAVTLISADAWSEDKWTSRLGPAFSVIDWSHPSRERVHEVLRRLTKAVGLSARSACAAALSQSYADLAAAQSGKKSDVFENGIDACISDWEMLGPHDRGLIEGVLVEPAERPAVSARMYFKARLALETREVEFPFDGAAAIAAVRESLYYDTLTCRLWLRHSACEADTRSFLLAMNAASRKISEFRGSLEAAGKRLGRHVLAGLVCLALDNEMLFDVEDCSTIMPSADWAQVVQHCASLLADAPNNQQREYVVGFLARWNPRNDEVRRMVIKSILDAGAPNAGYVVFLMRQRQLFASPPRGWRNRITRFMQSAGDAFSIKRKTDRFLREMNLL